MSCEFSQLFIYIKNGGINKKFFPLYRIFKKIVVFAINADIN